LRALEKFLTPIALKLYRGFILEKDIDPSGINPGEIKTILLVIRHMMGDMLCSIPMIESIRDSFPGSKIILVTKKSTNFVEIYNGSESPVDEVIYYESGFENFLDILKTLQAKNIDLAIVPSTVVYSMTNHLIAYHSKAKITAGVRSKDFDKNPSWYLLNIKNDFQWGIKKVHQIERNLDMIRQLNINPSKTKIELPVSDENKTYADDFYKQNIADTSRKVIGFHPGAGKESNIWQTEKFAELAERLYKNFKTYLLISEGPADKKCVEMLRKLLAEKYGITDYAVHKGTLAGNAAVINRLNLFVTNDTGIMHAASGLKTPLVALFGETLAYEWGPLGDNKFSIQSPNRNISGIDVDSVYKICEEVLEK